MLFKLKLMQPSFRRRGTWFVTVLWNSLHLKNKQTALIGCFRCSSRGNRLCDGDLHVGSLLESALGTSLRGEGSRVRQSKKVDLG